MRSKNLNLLRDSEIVVQGGKTRQQFFLSMSSVAEAYSPAITRGRISQIEHNQCVSTKVRERYIVALRRANDQRELFERVASLIHGLRGAQAYRRRRNCAPAERVAGWS